MINFKYIENALNKKMNKKKTIYVLKGFDLFIDKIRLNFKHVFNMKLSNDIYYLKNVDMKQLLIESSSLSEDIYYCLYEEMLIVDSLNIMGNINIMGYSIKIINLNIFDTYYPFFNQECNYDKIVFDFEDPIDNFIQTLFSFVLVEDNSLIVSYNPLSIELDEINLLEDSNELIVNEEKNYIKLFSNSSLPDYAVCIKKIIEANVSCIKYTIIDNSQNFKLLKLLNNLQHVGVGIFYESISLNTKLPKRHKEYLSILKRINKDYEFKNIKIYEDPFNSIKKIEINQSVIIDAILTNIENAKNNLSYRDIFVTAPTGAGKSILFQIPAIYALEKYNFLTLVISPLIGLMKDQVYNLQKMTDTAVTINSEFTPYQKDEIKNKISSGQASILYISPEALLSNADITSIIGERNIGLVVVDEAHTVATWGKNFRPDYWYLGEFIYRLRKKGLYKFPIATFTATATIGSENDMYHDIVDSLKMTPITFIGDVRRNNITFDIRTYSKQHDYQTEKFEISKKSIIKLAKDKKQKTLVYFPYVSTLVDMYDSIAEDYDKNKLGLYYGNLNKYIKDASIEDFRNGNINLILATKAFGMGIDIKDISTIYHFAPTGNITDYIQEIGRAARLPEIKGVAVTDYFEEDFRYINQLYGMSKITDYNIIAVLKKLIYKYKQSKKRNFLITPEEFAFIFDAENQDEVERRLKTVLLIIKKDFELNSRLNYVPIIFKPRGMYTKGIFLIRDNDIAKVKAQKIWKYLNLRFTKDVLMKTYNYGKTVSYLGDVYELDFRRIWEDKYDHMSFGAFKTKFYNNALNDIDTSIFIPKILLNVESKRYLFGEVLQEFNLVIDKIKLVLDEYHMKKQQFNHIEFADSLFKMSEGFTKKKLIEVVPPVLTMISSLVELQETNFVKMQFLRFNSKTNKYLIVSSTYARVLYSLKKSLGSFLYDAKTSKNKFSIMNKTDRENDMRSNQLLTAVQIAELFELVNYSYQSGDKPEYFVRVNSEYPIKRILENINYHSETLKLVYKMHCDSVRLMKYFFENLKSNEERWDFVEEYFLGVNLIEKYNLAKETSPPMKR